MNNENTIVEDLQTRIAFQEDMIAHLNTTVAKQQQEIDILQVQLQHIYKKIKALEGSVDEISNDSGGEVPPHY